MLEKPDGFTYKLILCNKGNFLGLLGSSLLTCVSRHFRLARRGKSWYNLLKRCIMLKRRRVPPGKKGCARLLTAAKNFRRNRFDTGLFCRYYAQLARRSGLAQMAGYPQHGSTSRLLHSVAVAYYSYRFAAAAPVTFHMYEMVRGALFHDYFFYDAQDGDSAHKGHWTRHPAIALENAKKELLLTGIEEDIIRSHMFPLTIRPPHFREAALVSFMDKACSVYEFFKRKDPYRKLTALVGAFSLPAPLTPGPVNATLTLFAFLPENGEGELGYERKPGARGKTVPAGDGLLRHGGPGLQHGL